MERHQPHRSQTAVGILSPIRISTPIKEPRSAIRSSKKRSKKIDIQNHFGYAQGWEESKQKYKNLVVLHNINPSISSENLIVKPEIATKQLEEEQVKELTSPVEVKAPVKNRSNPPKNPPQPREPEKQNPSSRDFMAQ
ncbi:hypothetical protein [Cylindrospermopsis raciborskii]|uniref:hypothetical protein n=1 Tax=Cylindrospermopsis raciborskii TaxID=77022 RepID=UPI001142DEE4|nr:hypothetical protein [Cylindrospermopsis raciborskii]TPX28713.1 hypothetical protein FIV49_11285 [Cylindrospermopsis raciborskii GIHE 2018]